MKIKRRHFIKTTGALALASIAQPLNAFTAIQSQATQQTKKPRIAVFFEESFPAGELGSLSREFLLQALDDWIVSFLGVNDLNAQLNARDFDLLVNPYGSMFPKEAWKSILKYLTDGGNLINLGGAPLSVPVVREGAGWRVEVRQTAYHKRLGITQAFPVDAKSISSFRSTEHDGIRFDLRVDVVHELYVRFTMTNDFPSESGSAGARDAVLTPLTFALGKNERKLAAPIVQIDRLQGDYAGGRWVLANYSGTISGQLIRELAERAMRSAEEFVVHPSFACYRDGELPAFTVQFRRPKGEVEKLIAEECNLEVYDGHSHLIGTSRVPLHGAGTTAIGYGEFGRKKTLSPGFYRVDARMKIVPVSASDKSRTIQHTTGFWIFDERLMARGKPLTVDVNYFSRDGEPCPITGTTYMGSDVHRKFLFEPNPYVWDRDFTAMKAAGVNMVRTGIWTGWKNYMLDVGVANESTLRAMDAFVLTARKHDIPLVVTFFAFLPETWGGSNAYLDPRAVNAQKEFVAVFAQRYRTVNDIVWDLINEPSFCNPQHLWQCRPNYDKYEQEAWAAWLKNRYPASSDEGRTSRLQEMYRCAADEVLSLPTLEDFEGVNVIADRRPIKVIDYHFFAQEMFARWVRDISSVIRSNGNSHQLITIGQDEGGTYDSPNNHFVSEAVDFTCLHNWWLNDDLLWDQIITKAPGKANLVEETGVMMCENMDGSAWRSEEEVRNLLERKFALSLGAGGAGFIEWIWNTNCYMASDNEAAIGFHRVDGTAKPEFEPFQAFTEFFRANRRRMNGRHDADVAMVIPHSQMYSTRNYATEATKKCVRVMHYHCNASMNAVSEYRLDSLPMPPKLLVVPSPCSLNEKSWQTVLTIVERGSTVLITGAFDEDEHLLSMHRLKQLGIKASLEPVSQEEFLVVDGKEYQFSFRGEKIQRVKKAVLEDGKDTAVVVIPRGQGKIIWSPLPMELAEPLEPIAALYSFALREANVNPLFDLEQRDTAILVVPTIYEDAILYTFLSECDRNVNVELIDRTTRAKLSIGVPAQRSVLVLINLADGRVAAKLGGEAI